ncbi:hypothetical protein F5Y15DRAFT_223479 [Xylariaceae sp. FL0016]|nr:hypothetical protein F5Y15DRAFT_223479 [Xylariaceae sp. FL0016]
MTTPLLRALFRQHLETLRARRLPHTTRRTNSSSSPSPNPTPKQASEAQSRTSKIHTDAKSAPKSEDPIPVPSTVAPLPFWQRLGPLTRAGSAYARAQRRRPWATQFASSLVIYLLADQSAQRMAGTPWAEHDLKRTGRALTIGGLASIPGYLWFVWLAQNFNYGSRVLSIGTKVVVNQIVFTPIFNSYFFGMQALLSGESLAETWTRIKKTVPVSFVNSIKLWPAVTAFSFTFVPLEYRSVFAGCVAVGWQAYLSFLNRKAEMEEAEERELALSGSSLPAEVRDARQSIAA